MPIPFAATASIVFKSVGGTAMVATVGAVTRETSNLTSTLNQLGTTSLQTSIKFQSIHNSLTLVTGSAAQASKELAQIDRIAQNTPGLRLESAEAGVLQLRALGVEARTAQRIVRELGEERLISLADEDAVQRVIHNFNQLINGSARASQDIKEILGNMPSLRKAFIDAFGTLDADKIFKNLKSPDEFIEKLLTAMEKTSRSADGLGNSWEKLADEWILAQREFNKPILKPAQELVDNLTKALIENKDIIREWGQTSANVVKFFADVTESRLIRLIARLTEYTIKLSNAGAFIRVADNYGESKGYLDRFLSNMEPNERELEAYYAKLEEAENKREIEQTNREQKALLERERLRNKNLQEAEGKQNNFLSRLESSYKAYQGAIRSLDANTFQEKQQKEAALFKLEQDYLQKRYNSIKNYYDYKIRLADSEATRQKLIDEGRAELAGVSSQMQINYAEVQANQKQILDDFQQALVDARLKTTQAQISGIQRELSDYFYKANKDLETGQLSPESYKETAAQKVADAYNKIIKLENAAFAEQKAISKKNQFEIEADEKAHQEKLNQLISDGNRAVNEVLTKAIEQRRSINQSGFQFELNQIKRDEIKALAGFGLGDFYNQAALQGVSVIDTQKTLNELLIERNKILSKTKVDSVDLFHINEKINTLLKSDENAIEQKYQIRSNAITEQINVLRRSLIDATPDQKKRIDQEIKDLETQQALLDVEKKRETANLKIQQAQNPRTHEERIAKLNRELIALRALNVEERSREIAAENNNAFQARNLELDAQLRYLSGRAAVDQDAVTIASKEKLIQLYGRETEAIIRQNDALIELSQKGIYSQTEVNARTLEFLNENVKSINEIAADARTKPIQAFWDTLENKISDATKSLGEFGRVGTQILMDLLKFATHKFLLRLFGLDSGSQAGFSMPGQAGSFNPLQMILGGGGAGGNGGGFSIPGFGGMINIGGGQASILSKIPILGKLFGGGGAAAVHGGAHASAMGLSSLASTSAGLASLGLGSATAAHGAAHTAAAGAAGGSGLMGSLGALFTNPWTAVIAGGILGGFALWKWFRRDDALKKLKEAAISAYSIHVKDKETLKQLQNIGDAYYGKGQAGKNADSVVKLEESRDLLRNYGIATGQNISKVDREKMGDPNWLGNQFSTPLQFGGFREFGGSVRKNIAYVVGEKRSELFVPNTNGTILPTTNLGSNISPEMIRAMMLVLGQLQSTVDYLAQRIQGIGFDEVVSMGAKKATGAIADAYESELQSNSDRTDRFMRLTGQGF